MSNSSISWADLEEDPNYDMFSPENVRKFLIQWHADNIKMGFISEDEPLHLPAIHAPTETKSTNQQPNSRFYQETKNKRAWRK